MTGYTVHTGASKKFVSGWDRVFGQGTAASDKKEKSASAGKSAAKKKSERSQNASGSAISAGKK
ncbi:MAG: hypothetical protein ACK50J_11295, partial [Planctomyces sp.]